MKAYGTRRSFRSSRSTSQALNSMVDGSRSPFEPLKNRKGYLEVNEALRKRPGSRDAAPPRRHGKANHGEHQKRPQPGGSSNI
jgi:hypothetical protein